MLRPVAENERALTERALALLDRAASGKALAGEGATAGPVPGWLAVLAALVLVVV